VRRGWITRFDKNIIIRVPKEMYFELIKRDNYSEWARTAFETKFEKENNGSFLDHKIKQHQEEIQRLKELKKQPSIKTEEINKILESYAPSYQQQAMTRSENQRLNFVNRTILPEIKRFGFKGSPQEIDDILINWPTSGGGSD